MLNVFENFPEDEQIDTKASQMAAQKSSDNTNLHTNSANIPPGMTSVNPFLPRGLDPKNPYLHF
jgi:hypothetical protein